MIGEALGVPEHRELAHLPGRLVGQGERARPDVAGDPPAGRLERAPELGVTIAIGSVGIGRPEPCRDRDVRLGHRGVGEDALQPGDRHRAGVDGTRCEKGRGQHADQPGRGHDRPVGAGAAKADLDHGAERRDQGTPPGVREYSRALPAYWRPIEQEAHQHVSVGTPFHPRTSPLNRKMQWREWSGYFASSVYADAHDIEYNAIREAAALIDVSPLYKYIVSGPDALRLVDRVVTRDATRMPVGGVIYTPWCDENGKVVDDGTIHRLDDGRYRWTAADPQLRWLRQNSGGLDVTIDEETEATAALALQGPLSRDVLEAATGESFADLRYFRRRASQVGKVKVDVSRTGYTGDLGYELWIPAASAVKVWDALMAAGAPYGIRPAGMLALDVVRLEAGLILLEVDYTSARHAMNPEQNYSPGEIGLGRLVDLEARRRLRRPPRARAGGARPVVRHGGWSASSSTGTTSRGCTTRRACRPRSARRWTARRSRSSPAAARSAGRRATAGARSSSRPSRSPRSRRSTRRWGPA